jgi:hypothetical protein
MDTRLIFRDHSETLKSTRVTRGGRRSVALELQRPRVLKARGQGAGNQTQYRCADSPRKAPRGMLRVPVPQTDTGGRVREHQGGRVSPR